MDIVRFLIDAAKNKSPEGTAPLHVAAQNGHIEIVRLLIQHGADKNMTDQHEATPLFKAAANGHIEIVRCLVQHGTGKNKSSDEGATPLKTWQPLKAMVKLLIA